jgi:hypothetical protein
MKTSILVKIVAPLTICAVFPLGAIAEPAFLRERQSSPPVRVRNREGQGPEKTSLCAQLVADLNRQNRDVAERQNDSG